MTTSNQNTIVKSSEYRNTYKETTTETKFRKIKFQICNVNYNDCISIKNSQGQIVKHPRVSWDPTTVSVKMQKSKKFQSFYNQFQHDILKEFISENGKLHIIWKDSYVPPSDIIDIY